MEENRFARAKSCYLLMVFAEIFTLIDVFLPDDSGLGGLVSLVVSVLALVALWRLRAVEDGYRNAFMVEIITFIFAVAGVSGASWATFSGNAVFATIMLFLMVAIPLILSAVLQYFLCTATGRVMEAAGATREAVWSGWMWKIQVGVACFGLLAVALALMGTLSVLLNGVSLAVTVLLLIYYFRCYKALSTE